MTFDLKYAVERPDANPLIPCRVSTHTSEHDDRFEKVDLSIQNID